jgi:hypothetical protein
LTTVYQRSSVAFASGCFAQKPTSVFRAKHPHIAPYTMFPHREQDFFARPDFSPHAPGTAHQGVRNG